MNVSGTSLSKNHCYSGMYGTCNTCDSSGSCVCDRLASGHSDMLTMDRTRWGGIVYVCSVDLRSYYAIWSLAIVISMILAAMCIYGLRIHVKTTLRMNQQVSQSRIVRFMVLVLMSALLNTALALLKIIVPAQLIGINPTVSLLFCMQQTFTAFAASTHTIHVSATTLSMQESTLGRTRISESISREIWGNYLLALLSSSPLAIPWIGALSCSAAFGQSEDLQTALLLATNVGMIVVYATNMIQQLRKTRRVVVSYERSIEALKASLVVAAGGASMAAGCMNDTAFSNGEVTRKPLYMIVIEQDILQLQSAQRNVREDTKKVKAGVILMVMIFAVSCLPRMWSRHSYSIAITNVLTKLVTCPMVRLYLPRRKPAAAASSAEEEYSPNSHGIQIVQTL